MTLVDLLSQLRGASLSPIRVEFVPEHSYDIEFVGTLDEYIEAAKALQSKVTFVSTITLSDANFLFDDPEADDDQTEIEDEERIDLCLFVPALKKFKDRIGEDGRIDLFVPLTNGRLTFSVAEDWMMTFAELHSKAQRRVQQSAQGERAQQKADDEARIQKCLGNVRDLISDKDFVRLSTQKAMLAYAIEKFPELEDCNEIYVKREIQKLKAKLEAKGIRRK